MAADKIIRNSKLDTFLSKLATKLTAIFWRKAETTQVSIDDTPTASSNNLVKSGGVKTYVDNAIPTVPSVSSNVATDKADNSKVAGAKAVYDEVHPATASSQPAGGMIPNIRYNLGTLSGNVTIAFASPSDSSIENEYKFSFDADSTAPDITWPVSITNWVGNCLDSNGEPEIKDSLHYEVSVIGGYGIIAEF